MAHAIVETVDKALRGNTVCSQPGIQNKAQAPAQVRLWIAEGIDAAWLKTELQRLARKAKMPVGSIRFFTTPVREDWQLEKARRATRRPPAQGEPQRIHVGERGEDADRMAHGDKRKATIHTLQDHTGESATGGAA